MTSNLISIYDLEILPNVYINEKSIYVQQALKQLINDKKYYEEDYEDVIDFGEFILTMSEVINKLDNRRGNENACKKPTIPKNCIRDEKRKLWKEQQPCIDISIHYILHPENKS